MSKQQRMIESADLKQPIGRQPYYEIKLKAPENPPCKTCHKNPRRDGSAYCGKCSINFHSGL